MSKHKTMSFLTAYEDGKQATIDKLLALDAQGFDFIEVLVPFSDPAGEMPEVQAASARALELGCTIDKVFELLEEVSDKLQARIILSSYANTSYKYGYDRFCKQAAQSGIYGLIVEDLPFEENADLKQAAQNYGVYVIDIIGRSPRERQRRVARQAQGILCISPAVNALCTQEEFDDIVAALQEEVRVPLLAFNPAAESGRYMTEI